MELHCGANMNRYAEYPASPGHPAQKPEEPEPRGAPVQEDVPMSSGSSGNETNDNRSPGRDSRGGQELGMLVGPPIVPPGPDAFGLMMAKSKHSTSASGCSEQSAKADAHKELIKTLRELKVHLPVDKKAKGKASMLATLKYALRSVKQVEANEEYYQLLMSSENHPCSASVPSYSIEEIESVTSDFIVKNVGMFAAAVSLVTGKILYISDQVASIFHCRRDAFYGARFVEFLAPHDVSVFHTSTTPYKLPPWSVCSRPGGYPGRIPQTWSPFHPWLGGPHLCSHQMRLSPAPTASWIVGPSLPHAPHLLLLAVSWPAGLHSAASAIPRLYPPDSKQLARHFRADSRKEGMLAFGFGYRATCLLPEFPPEDCPGRSLKLAVCVTRTRRSLCGKDSNLHVGLWHEQAGTVSPLNFCLNEKEGPGDFSKAFPGW